MNPEYQIGDRVRHTISEVHGVVIGITLRDSGFSYEISWAHDKCSWHYPAELELHTRTDRPIGFYS
jgi:hypothetical protein